MITLSGGTLTIGAPLLVPILGMVLVLVVLTCGGVYFREVYRQPPTCQEALDSNAVAGVAIVSAAVALVGIVLWLVANNHFQLLSSLIK